MTRVGAELRLGQERRPARAGDEVRGTRARGRVDAVEREAVRVVALEMGGVDLDDRRRAARAELNEDPVVARAATAAGLPAAAHVLGTAGHDEIVHGAKEGVRTGQ